MINTYFIYLLRIIVALNFVLFSCGTLYSPNAQTLHWFYAWLMYSSFAAIILAVLSFCTKVSSERRTGKLSDGLFAVIAILMLIFLSISSMPAL